MNNKKLLAPLGGLLLLMAVMVGLYLAARPQTVEGEKHITVEVVHGDGSSKTFHYQTQDEYLGELLMGEGLLVGGEGPYGLYIAAVDGEQAIYEIDGYYWAFYQDGEYAMQGVDLTPISDGDQFSFVHTHG